MKANETVICPACGCRTVAKLRPVMSGWQVAGQALVCALCGAELERLTPGKPPEVPAADAARSRLAALLGGEDETPRVNLDDGKPADFCRNCRYFVAHPFRTVCSRTGKDVDPMAGCGDFQPRKAD